MLLDPIAQVLLEKRSHMERGSAVATLGRGFFSRSVIERRGDVNELPLKIEAAPFQSRDFANPEAANGGDKEHYFERIGRNVDDTARRVSVEEKRLGLGCLVSGELDILLSNFRDEVAPLAASVQN